MSRHFPEVSKPSTMRDTPNALVLINIFLVGISICVGLYGLTVDGTFLFAFVSLLALISITLPMQAWGRTQLFEPLVLAAIAVLVGTTLRSFYLIALQRSGDLRLNAFTDGVSLEGLSGSAAWLILGTFSMALGYYMFARVGSTAVRCSPGRVWSNERVELFLWLAFVVSAIATVIYAVSIDYQPTGLADLSIKRAAMVITEDGETRYSRLSHLAMFAYFAPIGIYVLIIYYGSRKIARSPRLAVVSVMFSLITLAVPFMISYRTALVAVAFNVIFLLWRRGELRAGPVIWFIVFAGSVAVVMGELRQYDAQERAVTRSDVYSSELTQFEQGLFTSVVGSGNFVDVARVALIVQRVPERMNYLYGASYVSVLTGVIPRAIWPDKPETQLGIRVKEEIFGRPTARNGYPPTLFGEAYMNFGPVGLCMVPLIYGIFLRRLYEWYNGCSSRPGTTLIYAVSIFQLSFNGIGSNVAAMLVGVVPALLPALGTAWLLSLGSERREVRPDVDLRRGTLI
jgi:oligosaccharide repeat unit polymerase